MLLESCNTYLKIRPCSSHQGRLESQSLQVQKNQILLKFNGIQSRFYFDRIFDQFQDSSLIVHQLFFNLYRQIERKESKFYLFSGLKSTGKTVSCLGKNSPGVLVSFFEQLYIIRKNILRNLNIRMAVYEYRQQNFFDLLTPSAHPLNCKDFLYPLSYVYVNSIQEFVSALKLGLINNNTRDIKFSSFQMNRKSQSHFVADFLIQLAQNGHTYQMHYVFADLMHLQEEIDSHKDILASVLLPHHPIGSKFALLITKHYRFNKGIVVHNISLVKNMGEKTARSMQFFKQHRFRQKQQIKYELKTSLQKRIDKLISKLKLFKGDYFDKQRQEMSFEIDCQRASKMLISLFKTITKRKLLLQMSLQNLFTAQKNILQENLCLQQISDLYQARTNQLLTNKFIQNFNSHERKVSLYFKQTLQVFGQIKPFVLNSKNQMFESLQSLRECLLAELTRWDSNLFQNMIKFNSIGQKLQQLHSQLQRSINSAQLYMPKYHFDFSFNNHIEIVKDFNIESYKKLVAKKEVKKVKLPPRNRSFDGRFIDWQHFIKERHYDEIQTKQILLPRIEERKAAVKKGGTRKRLKHSQYKLIIL